LQALCALALCLFSFAASAQTLESSLAPYIHDIDCFGEIPGQSRTAVEPTTELPVELLCETMLLDLDGVAASEHDAAHEMVGAIKPQPAAPERSIPSDDKPYVR
jgi:hypothetical protein